MTDAACVAVALARAGHVHVTARCLRMLVRWAQDRGVAWVLTAVDDDPGLAFVATADDAAPGLSWHWHFGAPVLTRPWPKFGEDWR